jgi:hypothetical protein
MQKKNTGISIPKGFNFSSLYLLAKGQLTLVLAKGCTQKGYYANFSSSSLNLPLTTKQLANASDNAISNKAIATAINEKNEIINRQKLDLGPIKNGNGLLLNYKFLNTSFGEATKVTKYAGSNLAPAKAVGVANLSSEDIIKLISAFFKSIYCLISRPKFINTPDKIIIEILYYITIPDHNIFKWYNFIFINKNINFKKNKKVAKLATIKTILYKNYLIKKTLFKLNNTNIVNLYFNKFAILFKLLNNKIAINKPIEFNLIRIHKSDYDSNILAQLFILILKKKNIRIAINKIFNKNNITQKKENINIAAYISGLYIKIGGRLMREPIIPRLTTKKFEIGAIATGKVNFVDSARITKKNKKGAFTIKITYAQNFVANN